MMRHSTIFFLLGALILASTSNKPTTLASALKGNDDIGLNEIEIDEKGGTTTTINNNNNINCNDEHEKCVFWSERGECTSNPGYMLTSCKKSCGFCSKGDSSQTLHEQIKKIQRAEKECLDNHKKCQTWADAGECISNRGYMLKSCKKSCAVCDDDDDNDMSDSISRTTGNDECLDVHEKCETWAKSGECTSNPSYMLKSCKKSCSVCTNDDDNDGPYMGEIDLGVTQRAEGIRSAKVTDVVARTEQYIRSEIMTKSKYSTVRNECKNKHELCSFWVVLGECDTNPGYMQLECAAACQTCHLLIDAKNQCSLDSNPVDALYPGDLNRLFERITDQTQGSDFAAFNPVVHSRPKRDDHNHHDDKDGPWIVTLNNFLTQQECEHLLVLGGIEGYVTSEDGTHNSTKSYQRTFTSAFCTGKCNEDPIAQRVMERIAHLTGIPEINSEHLQLLRFKHKQFYEEHHDFVPNDVNRLAGPRILTVVLYLNDVYKGGDTRFPKLNVTIAPRMGKVLIWPNILDEDPNKEDPRTAHEALPVTGSSNIVKFAANAWIHLRDYKGPVERGCE